MGENSKAGCKGYYISAVNFDTSTLYLSVTQPTDSIEFVRDGGVVYVVEASGQEYQAGVIGGSLPPDWLESNTFTLDTGYEVGDEVSLIIYGFRTETQKVGGFHYNLLTTITAIDRNKITLALNPLPFTSLVPVSADYQWYSSFMVPAKPAAGAVELMANAAAFGSNTVAAGEAAFAEGQGTLVAGAYGHTEGEGTVAAYGAHAQNILTKALGMASHAQGESTEARGIRSTAMGYYTIAGSNNQVVEGKFNKIDTEGKYAHIVGGGIHFTDDKRKNIHTLDWSGNAWFAGDVTVNIQNEETSISEIKADTVKALALADEANKRLNKIPSISTYNLPNTNPSRTTLLSNLTVASTDQKSEYALVWGYGKTSEHYINSSSFSMLGGANNKMASSTSSVALGESNTLSNSSRAMAMGYVNSITDSSSSFAVGRGNNIITAPHSFVAGRGNNVVSEYQTVIGSYNSSDSDALFIIGSGTATNDRKNAFVVKKSGEAQVKSLTIGNTTFTESELKKVLNFINGIEVGGN